MNPSLIFRGRLIMQGAVLAEYVGDLYRLSEEYESSEKTPWDSAQLIGGFAFQTGMMGVGTMLVWLPVAKPYAIGRVGTWGAAQAAAAVTAAAPFTAGYLIGATIGTVVAEEVWGEEGAQVALGFYSAGLLPGTEAPDLTNYQYIFKPTAPGGPVSLYDVAEEGVKGTLRAIDWAWKKKPRLFRHRNPWMI